MIVLRSKSFKWPVKPLHEVQLIKNKEGLRLSVLAILHIL